MTAADQADTGVAGREATTPEPIPVIERLETVLGGDLTRLLLAALAGDQPSSRRERG